MSIKKFSISFIIMLIVGCMLSNDATTPAQRRKWMTDLRNYKQEFLIKELSLTKKQQDEFFPLYNQMEQEIYDVNKDAREIENKVSHATSTSEDEYERAANKMLQVKSKEAQIENFYYQKFNNILSKKQLFELQRAEMRFSRNMLQHHKAAQRQR